ncbi:MAG: hypothetical protein H6682_17110 [Candidatus Eisenbacteria bacterium]|nr:hypothetical protein [Candidatus Eisenbacteria bacterium]
MLRVEKVVVSVYRGFLLWGASILFASASIAQTPSMTNDMPPEIKSWRDEFLPQDRYAELADEWRAYSTTHPESAVARVQLARALRYARTASPEEIDALIDTAYEIDPRCPEALAELSYRAYVMGWGEEFLDQLEVGRRQSLEAIEIAPNWAYPYFGLWNMCVLLGRHDEAKRHLEAILDKGAYPATIVDFGYNLLVSARPNAIVFTNGDNDTYPPLAVQAKHGICRDVAIVNLSLLNRLEYATQVWKARDGSAPMSDDEIRTLYSRWEADPGEMSFAKVLMLAILDQSKKDGWETPIYFASTVSPQYLEVCPYALRIEGLLLRVTRDPKPDEDDAETAIDSDRTLTLYRTAFRMDSATDLSSNWGPRSPARRLMQNYAAILRSVASEAARKGNLEEVRYALGEAIRLLDFSGESEMASSLAKYWKEVDPDAPPVDRRSTKFR